MRWLYLLVAIAFEISGTTSLKYSEGFTKPVPAVLVCVFYGLSFYTFSQALKSFEIGTAYAIWSGLGTAATAVIGVLVFREELTLIKGLSLGLIILGVIGLNIGGK